MNEQLITFFVVSLFLVVSPGPNMALVIDNATRLGKKNSMLNILGLCSATYIHGALSILGVSIIILNDPSLYLLIKFLGAAYLLYMGIKSTLSGITLLKTKAFLMSITGQINKRTLFKSYVDGFITQILNPKVSMFYIAAFPSFLMEGSVYQGFELVSIHSMNIFLWFTLLTIFISFATEKLKKSIVRGWLNIATGLALSVFALIIALH